MPATRDLGCSIDELERIIYRGLMCPVPGYVQVAAVPRLFRGAAGFFRGERRAIPGPASGTGCHLGIEPVGRKVRVFAFQTASKFQKYCKAGATTTIRCPW